MALYHYFYEGGSKQKIIEELAKYQNEDGGFGHGLEADNWNPNSNPIATNDALITLHRISAMDECKDMIVWREAGILWRDYQRGCIQKNNVKFPLQNN